MMYNKWTYNINVCFCCCFFVPYTCSFLLELELELYHCYYLQGIAEKNAVQWLTEVIEEEAKRAKKIMEGALIPCIKDAPRSALHMDNSSYKPYVDINCQKCF